MTVDRTRVWRALFVIGGVLYMAGSSQHPRGAMVDMLADPTWVAGHTTIFVGLLVLTAGLLSLRRTSRPSPSLRRWLLFLIVATGLEAVEMAVHTIAYVDAGALAAGEPTPVLTTHLWLATVIYPLFAVPLCAAIWIGQRERSIGSAWIGWVGIIGAAAHGAVMWLVFIFEVAWAGILFPIAALSVSAWFILAGLWPVPRSAPAASQASEMRPPFGAPSESGLRSE